MTENLQILICSSLLAEARKTLGTGMGDDVVLSGFPVSCGSARTDQGPLNEASRLPVSEGSEVHVICGGCVGDEASFAPKVLVHRFDPCSSIVAGVTVVDKLIAAGAYLVTPGWLRAWPQHLGRWGFTKAIARDFFHESTSRVVLLDTLDDDSSRERLEQFAAHVGLPWEVVPVGSDLLSCRINGIIHAWRTRRSIRDMEAAQAQTNRRLADFALVHDVLARLVNLQSEGDLIPEIFDLFGMLFAPATIAYRSMRKMSVQPARLWPDGVDPAACEPPLSIGHDEDSSWSAPGTDVTLRIRHMDETLAFLELREIACPEYRQHSTELGGILIRLCGLAIANARNYQTVQELAETDELTGLANRRRFFALAERQFMLARRHGYRLCVMMLDIDYFKKVNDGYGHATGDRVLRGVAQACQESIRLTDILGRYGGEEFAVVLHETDLAGAVVAAERIRSKVESLTFDTERGPLRVTISLGVAPSAPGRSLGLELERADAALYRAKAAGRNRSCCAEME